ncbi:DUF58 domain-containing protein [Georgenia yuyongxinii]|uniref:DUF58 domain-containing protein n=2 Tax=Georgenia yuyongxinii TaxID=2589797 RepID=A0A552WPW8_9MICO|nr:DUF58 domain-containing protein [Georgenia yuyongxinii]
MPVRGPARDPSSTPSKWPVMTPPAAVRARRPLLRAGLRPWATTATSHLTTRGRAFTIAGGATVVVGLVVEVPDVTRIGLLLLLLPAALVLTGRRTPSLAAHRAVSTPLLPHDGAAQVELRITNPGWRTAPPAAALEHLSPALGGSHPVVLPTTEPGTWSSHAYLVRGTVRGRHTLGPLVLHRSDPFGLTRTDVELLPPTDIVVLPRVEALPGETGLTGAGARSRPSPTAGENDVATRPFRVGDDLRRVHWPASAHHGHLIVRQEDHPVGPRARLLLDASWSAHRGTGPTSSFEWAVTALASVATALATHGCGLHLVTAETVRDGVADRPLVLATVLRYLAVADLVDHDLGGLLPVLGPAGAGTTVAVVPDRDLTLFLAGAGPRSRAGDDVLLVLRTRTFDGAGRLSYGSPVPAAPAPLPGLPRTPGWRCVEVRAGTTVRAAWHHAAVSGPVPAGWSRR